MRAVARVEGGRRWCGPTAIAAVLHVDYDTALRAAERVTGKKVTGLAPWALARTLRSLGANVVDVPIVRKEGRDGYIRPMEIVRDFAKRMLRRGGTYIVATRGHYLALDGLIMVDNTVDRPTWVYDRPDYLRRRIVWAVEVRR